MLVLEELWRGKERDRERKRENKHKVSERDEHNVWEGGKGGEVWNIVRYLENNQKKLGDGNC